MSFILGFPTRLLGEPAGPDSRPWQLEARRSCMCFQSDFRSWTISASGVSREIRVPTETCYRQERVNNVVLLREYFSSPLLGFRETVNVENIRLSCLRPLGKIRDVVAIYT